MYLRFFIFFLHYIFFAQSIVRCQCFLSYLCNDLILKTAIKLYLRILNVYLTAEVKRGDKVWFCGDCALTLNYYKIINMLILKVWQLPVLSPTVRLTLFGLYNFEK